MLNINCSSCVDQDGLLMFSARLITNILSDEKQSHESEFNYKSLYVQLHSGTLALAIETGRFNSLLEEKRCCSLCDLGETEDLVFYRSLYDN